MGKQKELKISPGDFSKLIKRAQRELLLCDEDLVKLSSIKQINNDGKKWKQRNSAALWSSLIFFIILGIPSICFILVQNRTTVGSYIVQGYFDFMDIGDIQEQYCAIDSLSVIYLAFRPPINCSECAGITDVKRVKNLSYEDFLNNYAFTMQPVVIEDGQRNWTAAEIFSYKYFRNLYSVGSEALRKVEQDCQFFPYSTEFSGLEEFFNISEDRVAGKDESWYVGWSNCDGNAANELRKHYNTPYFLPPELDHSKIDWIFMGLPGYGAPNHIDNVGTNSWQAQVRGTKKWTLETAPECHGICSNKIEIIVKPGDIIVLDGNRWFHSTEIIGNDTSIVIGSEYY